MQLQADGKETRVKFHALDKGQGPLLFGNDALRGLGAIVDFSTGDIIYTKVAPTHMQTMELSRVGHYLIDLTEDLVANAKVLESPVKSLRELVSHQNSL